MTASNDDTTLISFKAQVKLVKHSRMAMIWVGLIAGALALLGAGGYFVYYMNEKQNAQAAEIQKARSKMDVPAATPQ